MTAVRAPTAGEAAAVAALRSGDAAARLRALRDIKNQVIGAQNNAAARSAVDMLAPAAAPTRRPTPHSHRRNAAAPLPPAALASAWLAVC
jgi:hypothetical protein